MFILCVSVFFFSFEKEIRVRVTTVVPAPPLIHGLSSCSFLSLCLSRFKPMVSLKTICLSPSKMCPQSERSLSCKRRYPHTSTYIGRRKANPLLTPMYTHILYREGNRGRRCFESSPLHPLPKLTRPWRFNLLSCLFPWRAFHSQDRVRHPHLWGH